MSGLKLELNGAGAGVGPDSPTLSEEALKKLRFPITVPKFANQILLPPKPTHDLTEFVKHQAARSEIPLQQLSFLAIDSEHRPNLR